MSEINKQDQSRRDLKHFVVNKYRNFVNVLCQLCGTREEMLMAAGLKVSLPDTEEACKDKAQSWSVELDHSLQTRRCLSLWSTSAAVFWICCKLPNGAMREGERCGTISRLHCGGVDSNVPHVRVETISVGRGSDVDLSLTSEELLDEQLRLVRWRALRFWARSQFET